MVDRSCAWETVAQRMMMANRMHFILKKQESRFISSTLVVRLLWFFESCTSGRAGGLICEPLKAVWPAYAGIVTRISLVDRASYLLSLVPLCTLESGPPHR